MDIHFLSEALESLKKANQQLQKIDVENRDMLEDSCVKRFEYTLATAMKIMRKMLKEEYFKDEADLTVNNIFRIMNSYGFIQDWKKWREYYQQRNNTAHEYSAEKARELLKNAQEFINDCEFLINKLRATISQEPFFEKISEILLPYKNKWDFFAYGSRIKGNFQKSSDLDILVKGKIPIDNQTLTEINEKIDNSDIPFVVHFSDYQDMNQNFYENIKNDLQKL